MKANVSDIEEVQHLLDQLRWLSNQMPNAIRNWMSTKPNCLFYTGALKSLCENPAILNRTVFDPLIKWLSDYILLREKRITVQTLNFNSLDDFLKVGLRVIAKFIIVAEFFADHTDLFVPNSKDLSKMGQIYKQRDQYKEFINILLSRLIGCNDKLSFLFLKLSGTISNLSDELKLLRTHLDDKCLDLRKQALKM